MHCSQAARLALPGGVHCQAACTAGLQKGLSITHCHSDIAAIHSIS
jgi:hypothetical protein